MFSWFYHRILLHLISTTKGRIEVVHVKFQEICYLDFGQVVPVLYSGFLGTSIYAGLGTQTMCPITNNQISRIKPLLQLYLNIIRHVTFQYLFLSKHSVLFSCYIYFNQYFNQNQSKPYILDSKFTNALCI